MSPPEKYPQDQKQDDGQGRQDRASASAFCLTMFFLLRRMRSCSSLYSIMLLLTVAPFYGWVVSS